MSEREKVINRHMDCQEFHNQMIGLKIHWYTLFSQFPSRKRRYFEGESYVSQLQSAELTGGFIENNQTVAN